MKGKTHDLNHDLTFSAHIINCVCHSIRSMFGVLGIYNFVFCTKKKQKRKEKKEYSIHNIISGLLNSMVWKENEESGWCTNLCTLVKLKATSSEIRTFLGGNSIHRVIRQ